MRDTGLFWETGINSESSMIKGTDESGGLENIADAVEALHNERRKDPLRVCVRHSLDIYFQSMGGHEPKELYELVLSEVERPLLEVVMEHSRGNITKAAEMLGINRGTLRKKLKKYDLD